MRKASFSPGRVLVLLLFMAQHLAIGGCNDPSRTTGTMVEVSDEVKAHRKAKIEAYKGGPAKKAKGVSGKR